jgi:hypothetical protein
MKPAKIEIRMSEKLALRRETIVELTPRQLAKVGGGVLGNQQSLGTDQPNEPPTFGVLLCVVVS